MATILGRGNEDPSSRKAIAHAASTLAQELKLQGIVVPTRSGFTAAVLSANRPFSPLLAASSNIGTCQKLAMHWGVIPFLMTKGTVRDWNALAQNIGEHYKLSQTAIRVLLVSGFNDDEELNEPVLKIIKVKHKGLKKS